MPRVVPLPALVLLLMATLACSDPQVVAEVAILQEGTSQSRPLADVPIRLLPYDRDAIFDSLAAAAETPEPAIPPDLQQQRQAVQEAQQLHEQVEARWSALRDSLTALSAATSRMEQQNLRSTPEYLDAFNQFNRLDAEVDRVKLQMDQAFQNFSQLQGATLGRTDSLRIARESWAEEAFSDFERVVAAKQEQLGRQEVADTTSAVGVASFSVGEGRWWVYGRYTLPYEELYWNVPMEVTGDSVHVRLTDENAEKRPVL